MYTPKYTQRLPLLNLITHELQPLLSPFPLTLSLFPHLILSLSLPLPSLFPLSLVFSPSFPHTFSLLLLPYFSSPYLPLVLSFISLFLFSPFILVFFEILCSQSGTQTQKDKWRKKNLSNFEGSFPNSNHSLHIMTIFFISILYRLRIFLHKHLHTNINKP